MQLALVGSMAHDDPEGWEFYNRTVEYADDDPDIHILSNLNNVGAVEVNAFQVHADVCIQKSIKEGFGLTVSEALWKARPMIGGRRGRDRRADRGRRDRLPGQLGRGVRRSAASTILADPADARQMARRGKEQVRRSFLTPRLVRDWLALMHRLEGERSSSTSTTPRRDRAARRHGLPCHADGSPHPPDRVQPRPDAVRTLPDG